MEINAQVIEFVKTELSKLEEEKVELETMLKNVNDDIFALNHLLNRVKITDIPEEKVIDNPEEKVIDNPITEEIINAPTFQEPCDI